MSLKDAAELVHFRELHLLPRTIFSIGAICFLGAFFLKTFLLGFFGVGVIFIGLTLNFALNFLVQTDISISAKRFKVAWTILFQLIICGVISYWFLGVFWYYYRYGEMPPYLHSLPPPH